MKKTLTIALTACFAMSFNATAEDTEKKQKKGNAWSEDEWVAKAKDKAQKNDTEFNEARARAAFKKVDADGDGEATGKERKAFFEKMKAERTAGKTKKGKGGGKTWTEEAWLTKSKARAEAANKDFNEEKAKAFFKKLDTNSDGKVTPEERKANAAKLKAKKAGENSGKKDADKDKDPDVK